MLFLNYLKPRNYLCFKLLLAGCCTSTVSLVAQGFVNIAEAQGMTYTNNLGQWGSGISTADWNSDGWPDVTICQTHGPAIIYTNHEGIFEEEDFAPCTFGEGKSIHWVDVNDDGQLELFIAQELESMMLFERVDSVNWESRMEDSGLPIETPWASCASWADIDHDGDLDLYLGSYILDELGTLAPPEDPDLLPLWNSGSSESWPVVTNKLFRNDGDFVFTDITPTSFVDNGIQLTLATLFHDVDLDGWVDLLVANDKFNANAYYRNLGNESFEDLSLASGFDVVIDAMNLSEGDINRDGTRDFLITNIPESTDIVLSYNPETGVFDDITAEHFGGLLENRWTWSGIWMDVENDGDLDLYIAEHYHFTPYILNHVYLNDGSSAGYAFSIAPESTFPLDYTNSHSAAQSDWNRDGRIDFAVHSVGNHRVRMWENQLESEGNWIQVDLEGTTSNTFGVGSWIEIFCGWESGPLRTYTTLGADYLGQSDYVQHFGIGASEGIDSVRVIWPTGNSEIWTNIAINTNVHLIENTSNLEASLVSQSGPFCPNDQGQLFAELSDGVEISWMDGSHETSLSVDSAQWVSWTLANNWGQTLTDSIFLTQAELEPYQWLWTPPLCADLPEWSSLDLLMTDSAGNTVENTAYMIILGNDTLDFPIDGDNGGPLQLGSVPLQLIHLSGCTVLDTVILDGPSLLSFEWTSTTPLFANDTVWLCDAPEDWTWEITGGTAPFTVSVGASQSVELANNSLTITHLNPGDAMVTITDNSGCILEFEWYGVWSESLQIEILPEDPINGETGSFDAEVTGGFPPLDFVWAYAADSMDILLDQPNWTELTLTEAEQGLYQLTVTDGLGCSVDTVFWIEWETLEILFEPAAHEETMEWQFIDEFWMEWTASSIGNWRVYDTHGRLCLQSDSPHRKFRMPLEWCSQHPCIVQWRSISGKPAMNRTVRISH